MKRCLRISIYLLILLSLFGCGVKNFKMPVWDVNMNVPLMNKHFYVTDLVNSENNIYQDSTHVYFSSSGNVNSFELNELKILPSSAVTLPLISNSSDQGSISLASITPTDRVQVSYGIVQSGTLRLITSNIVTGFQTAHLVFAELYKENGQNFDITITGGNQTRNIDLHGLRIGTPTNTSIVEDLHFELTTTANLPANTPAGQLDLILNQEMLFTKIIGNLYDYVLDVRQDSTSITIEYPLGIEEAVHLHDATLKIDLLNNIGFDCELHGNLVAYNANTDSTVVVPLVDNSNQPFVVEGALVEGQARPTTVIFQNGLDQLMSVMPTKLSLRDAYFVMNNASQNFGFAGIGNTVTGSYMTDIPLHFSLYSHEIIPSTLDSLSISEANRKRMRTNINEAHLVMLIKNQLPIGASFEIYFSSNPAVFENTELIRSGMINAGAVNDGYQELGFDLNHDEIQVFDTDKLYMKYKITFHATQGPVVIEGSSADFIQIIGRVDLNARIEE